MPRADRRKRYGAMHLVGAAWAAWVVAGMNPGCAVPGIERAHAPPSSDWLPGPAPAGEGTHTTIAVLGETHASGANDGVVRAMAAELGAARAQGQSTTAIWLGHHASLPADPKPATSRDCPEDYRPWSTQQFAPLRALGETQQEDGGQSFTLPGFNDWTCDQVPKLREDPNAAWTYPGFHYVLRIDASGRSQQAFDCDASGQCQLAPAPEKLRVELVFVDLSPLWLAPDEGSTAQGESQSQLDQLLEAYAKARDTPPPYPRILVTHLPAESAGRHGHGTNHTRATFLGLPSTLRELLGKGAFNGIIAGHELAHHGVRDIANGVFRSARVWLDYPVFQVVAGRSGAPRSAKALWESQRVIKTSVAMIPDYRSVSPGYSSIRISDEHIELVTVVEHDAGPYHHVERVPLRPAKHPTARALPSMVACLYCDPEDGAADGPRWRSRIRQRSN